MKIGKKMRNLAMIGLIALNSILPIAGSYAKDKQPSELFSKNVPIERQFKQANQGDCQTVAALKYLALTQPETIENMIKKDNDSYIVHFPKTDITKVNSRNAHFNYDKNVINVSNKDISAFREWYGQSGSLAQDIIYSALIKRMQYYNNKDFSSVKDYIKELDGLSSMFLGTSEDALFILTGDAYKTKERTEDNLNIDKIRKLFKEGKIGSVSQGFGYFNEEKFVYYNSEFKNKGSSEIADRDNDGIVEGHAYATVYDEKTDSVTIYNPWNKIEPKKNDIDDGIFKLSLEEFLEKFTYYSVKDD